MKHPSENRVIEHNATSLGVSCGAMGLARCGGLRRRPRRPVVEGVAEVSTEGEEDLEDVVVEDVVVSDCATIVLLEVLFFQFQILINSRRWNVGK